MPGAMDAGQVSIKVKILATLAWQKIFLTHTFTPELCECLFEKARQPIKVWSFSHNSNKISGQIFSHYPFILAFFGKNVLLTAKIKNTIIVAVCFRDFQ